MKILNAFADASDTHKLMKDIMKQIKEWPEVPSVLIVYFNTRHNAIIIQQQLAASFSCPFMMESSCKGAFAITPFDMAPSADISIFAICDPDGHYGIGYANIAEKNAKASASEALAMALNSTQVEFETPSMIIAIMPPGQEEELIEGFAQLVGPHVPVFGGSSADNDVTGAWFQATHSQLEQNSVICLAMYPSTPISASYSSGYQSTDERLVTGECEGRVLGTLNNEPAATVYNRLTNASIADALSGGNVLANTTLHPLGTQITSPAGITEYLLCHPDSVTNTGALTVFSNVENGRELHLMEGSAEGLVNRARAVIQNAIQLLPEGNKPCGVLLIYCAGCMLTIDDGVARMQQEVKNIVGDVPVSGAYTFGEQGCFLDGKNRHGNLMISAVVFSQ